VAASSVPVQPCLKGLKRTKPTTPTKRLLYKRNAGASPSTIASSALPASDTVLGATSSTTLSPGSFSKLEDGENAMFGVVVHRKRAKLRAV
jgi:hypothetical protein